MVWLSGNAAAEECPTSLVTAASVELVEKFLAWKFAGPAYFGQREMTAREAEAFTILEQEWRADGK